MTQFWGDAVGLQLASIVGVRHSAGTLHWMSCVNGPTSASLNGTSGPAGTHHVGHCVPAAISHSAWSCIGELEGQTAYKCFRLVLRHQQSTALQICQSLVCRGFAYCVRMCMQQGCVSSICFDMQLQGRGTGSRYLPRRCSVCQFVVLHDQCQTLLATFRAG